MRKWVPQGENFAGDAIFQVVVPAKLRQVKDRLKKDRTFFLLDQ